MTESQREKLRILSIAAIEALERLRAHQLINVANRAPKELADIEAAYREAEVEWMRASRKLREYQETLARLD